MYSKVKTQIRKVHYIEKNFKCIRILIISSNTDIYNRIYIWLDQMAIFIWKYHNCQINILEIFNKTNIFYDRFCV